MATAARYASTAETLKRGSVYECYQGYDVWIQPQFWEQKGLQKMSVNTKYLLGLNTGNR